jgi:hypothetical protein
LVTNQEVSFPQQVSSQEPIEYLDKEKKKERSKIGPNLEVYF